MIHVHIVARTILFVYTRRFRIFFGDGPLYLARFIVRVGTSVHFREMVPSRLAKIN